MTGLGVSAGARWLCPGVQVFAGRGRVGTRDGLTGITLIGQRPVLLLSANQGDFVRRAAVS